MAGSATSEWCIGLMSGTSVDGVDGALIKTDGDNVIEYGATYYLPYTGEFRERIKRTFGQIQRNDDVDAVEHDLTMLHADVVKELLNVSNLSSTDVKWVGFHGQTTHHDPKNDLTIQLGDGPLLASETGIPVVYDFRSADVAAGGEGAPLAPVFHKALVEGLEGDGQVVAVLNLGGVANVTVIDAEGHMLAFDTGPANALMDDFIMEKSSLAFDYQGARARTGKIEHKRLSRWMKNQYFEQTLPKSLDRNAFNDVDVSDLSLEDGLATLAAFTVSSIVWAGKLLPTVPDRWLVTGGGRKNIFLMELLEKSVKTKVSAVEDVNWDGDALEAQAFAFLAKRCSRGLPISFPLTTGAPKELTGGQIVLPPA